MRAETLFNELWSNGDDANYAAAQRVLDGRYTWLEDGIADPSGDGPMMPPLDDEGAAREKTASSREGSPAGSERAKETPVAAGVQ